MFNFKLKITLQHNKFNSLNETFYLKKKELNQFLHRIKDQKNWLVIVKEEELSKSSKKQLLTFIDKESNNQNVKEFKKHAQDSRIQVI